MMKYHRKNKKRVHTSSIPSNDTFCFGVLDRHDFGRRRHLRHLSGSSEIFLDVFQRGPRWQPWLSPTPPRPRPLTRAPHPTQSIAASTASLPLLTTLRRRLLLLSSCGGANGCWSTSATPLPPCDECIPSTPSARPASRTALARITGGWGPTPRAPLMAPSCLPRAEPGSPAPCATRARLGQGP